MTLVEGRLIDARTGEPITEAWVLGMHVGRDSDAHVARAKDDNAERRAGYAQYAGVGDSGEAWQKRGLPEPEALVDDEGRFRLRQWVGTSTAKAHSGRILSQTGHEPRTGMDLLYIERDGLPPVRIPVPRGVFRWAPDGTPGIGDVGAYWDLGDIRVPPPDPR